MSDTTNEKVKREIMGLGVPYTQAAYMADEFASGQYVTATGDTTARTLADWMVPLVNVTYSAGLFDYTGDTIRLVSEGGSGKPQIILKSTNSVTPDGEGGFIRFNTLSDAGTARDGLQLNGGLVDATDGAECGLLDIGAYRDGTYAVCFTIDASIPAVFPGNEDDVYSFGTSNKRWKGAYFSAPIVNAVGAVGAPSYTFAGDTDSGMYWAAANDIRIATGGSGRLRVTGAAVEGLVPLKAPSYAVSGAPSASTAGAGAMIYVTDGNAGSACFAVSDGSNWKVIALGATISAS